MKAQDRPYQARAVESIQFHYENGQNRQLVSWATGAGKTWLIAKIPYLINPHKRTLVLVHTEELMKQAKEKIERWNPGLHVGVEMGMLKCHDDHQVIVGSVQTLGSKNGKRLAKFKPEEFGAIVTDEAHHATASGYVRIFKHFGVWDQDGVHPRKDILSLGVTATPSRTDKVGLKEVYDVIADEYTMIDAIRDRFLTDLRAYRVISKTSLDQVKSVAGDLQQDQLAAAVNNKARNELIVRKWAEVAAERKTVVFTVNIQHAQTMAAEFRQAGYNFGAVWGTDPDRDQKIADLHSGKLQGLCNAMLLTEGFDCPDVSCVVLARPTSSKLVYVQQVGRGTRLAAGKTDCFVIDVTDNTTKHKIISAATLAGLPAQIDINGQMITELAQSEMAKKVAKLDEKVDLSQIQNLGQLDAYLREVELFQIPREVEENSKLNWIKVNDNRYVLTLPGKDNKITIDRSANSWDVVGKVSDTTFGDRFPNIKEAMSFADRNLQRFGKEMVALKAREGKEEWRNKPASESMKKWLKFFFSSRRMAMPDLSNITRGQASKLMDKFTAK